MHYFGPMAIYTPIIAKATALFFKTPGVFSTGWKCSQPMSGSCTPSA